MRYFYIFNISNEFINLNKTKPYNLFKTFYELYNMPKDELIYGINIYDNMTKPIDKNYLNIKLYEDYHNNYYYKKFKNMHLYNDYYSKEDTILVIKNAFMYIKTTAVKPSFFNYLNKFNTLFVCDFDNEDYFWLESVA